MILKCILHSYVMNRIFRTSHILHFLWIFRSNSDALAVSQGISKSALNFSLRRQICTESRSFPAIIQLFTHLPSLQETRARCIMMKKVLEMADDIIANSADANSVDEIMEDRGSSLLKSSVDGSALIELLAHLRWHPHLAIQVFNWRRQHADQIFPITGKEYAKGIAVAGLSKNVELAAEIFTEAAGNGIKDSHIYNSLMDVYRYSGLYNRCQLLFEDFKKEDNCSPTKVTYNILISVFGRMMLVDNMEKYFKEMKDSNILPDIETYNNLISGYIVAWMWDSVEEVFNSMVGNGVIPNTKTYCLMLRGYAHSGDLEKMADVHDKIKVHVVDDIQLIRIMIIAYFKSSVADRVQKIEELVKFLPKNVYISWLNILLIRLFAQENSLDCLENSINEAFAHDTHVRSDSLMRIIISSYYRCNAVEKLADFLRRAEAAGWKICRSIFHCKMVMYAAQYRFVEMENVLNEMINSRFFLTRRTFIILFKAYSRCEQRYNVERILGLMHKHGFDFPFGVEP